MTFNAQGNPQLTMVEEDFVAFHHPFNTAEERKKPQNLRRDLRVIVSVQGRDDPKNLGRLPRQGSDH